jgi:hypothetical protein
MTHFLWVEDFNISETKRSENIVSSTVSSVFGSILDNTELSARLAEEDENDAQDFLEENGIFLKLNLLEALDFINDPKELSKIDFVVLDVDMPLENGQRDNNNYLSSLIERCPPEDALRKIAGYHIYTELVIELGFPKKHILFCSNHASYFEELKNKFSSANIKPPISPNSNEPFLRKEDKGFINQWLNDAHLDYFVLRRGIIEGCKYLKSLSEDKLQFKEFIKKDDDKKIELEDIRDYLGVLENFLPLREPSDKAARYKLFVRTLAHEWEAAEPKQLNGQKELYALSWIMKMSRNWLAHGKVFEQLTAQDVAYLFIVNMRAMFDLGSDLLPYERNLLSLFTDVISVQEMQDKIGKGVQDRKIPLVENYAVLLKKTGNTWQAINFHDALNNLQKNKNKVTESEFLIKGLYQTFWFLTSSGSVFIPFDEEKIKGFTRLQYQFNYFDYHYQKQDYLFELARHIYSRSFSQD